MAIAPEHLKLSVEDFGGLAQLQDQIDRHLFQFKDIRKPRDPFTCTLDRSYSPAVISATQEIYRRLGWQVTLSQSPQSVQLLVRPKPPVPEKT